MEEYKNYVRQKSLENIMGFILIMFVFVGIFVVTKTFDMGQKYAVAHSSVMVDQ